MGQFTLYILFFITLIVGALAYFSPKQQVNNPLKVVMGISDDGTADDSIIKKTQQLNMTTNSGVVDIRNQLDSLTQKKNTLVSMINDEQQVLGNTNKEIDAIGRQVNGKSDLDILKLKTLGSALEDQRQLLIEHGQQLIALNDQIAKNRQLLADEREQVNINTASSLQSLQENNSSQRAQDLIDQERQKAQDQQEMIQQRMADQEQRMQDQQNR